MADSKISDLPAVVTPATTDEFAVNQGGTSKKETLEQVRGDLIADVLLDSTLASPAASFTISNVDDEAYDWVEIFLWMRSAVAAVGEDILVAFNADTTAGNYRWARHYAGSGHGSSAASDRVCGEVVGASAPSDAFSPVRILIIHPGSSHYKAWLHESQAYHALDGSIFHFSGGGSWENTAAITSIVITSTSASNFATGSKCVAIGYRTP